ncbi:hypothetical protein PLESTB_000983000 [Pleodorina starrii]|uniref:Uncharacterized protein n=1 Tax=Pleodorina starrii TaxID=330485 RepID=A0A9W6F4H9_9CHLO|nr:hypothetical protein PLESTM_000545700 [Pleodorina starrii]GLC55396.1 hypothetical protein PLESTB_000983000 [Pleodorina starrii]GLC73792.1 hypothetical protein PLESTF_001421700 [Pleodorina starrii]
MAAMAALRSCNCKASLQRRAAAVPRLQIAAPTSRRRLTVVAGQAQSGNTATKRRLSGPPNLPPVDSNGGGGGGGDGWGWERSARNVAPNLFVLGLYFFITSYGGDNFGGGGGGGGGGDGGGGGGGGNGGFQPDGDGAGNNPHRNESNRSNDQSAHNDLSEESDDEEDVQPRSRGGRLRKY